MAYEVQVNKGSLSATMLTGETMRRRKSGWYLHSLFEQKGNTVIVWENDRAIDQLLEEQRRTNQLLEWLGQRLPATG